MQFSSKEIPFLGNYSTLEHPPKLKKSSPYGQRIRLKRIRSQEKDYEDSRNDLSERLTSRGSNYK